MIKILRLAAGFLAGALIGILLAGAGFVLFTDMSFDQFLAKLTAHGMVSILVNMLLSIAAFATAIVLQIAVHEAGHLVGGLLTGYRFVSYRLFSLTVLRRNGCFTVRNFIIPGTGGQCIMLPPDGAPEQVPFMTYNAGGVAANIILTVIAATIFLTRLHDTGIFLFTLSLFTSIVGLWLIIFNGIPMNPSGIGNDASNIRMLRSDPDTRRHFVAQLRINALCQDGVRLKDMPDEWFGDAGDSGNGNIMRTATALNRAGQQLDRGLDEAAYSTLAHIMDNKEQLPALLVKETTCEMAYISLALGRADEARELLTHDLRTYIRALAGTSSDKQRLLCAMALILDNDLYKAQSIYRNTAARRDKYLLAGTADMDIELMGKLISQHDSTSIHPTTQASNATGTTPSDAHTTDM